MNSREKILAAVKKNQPALEQLPDLAALDAIQFDNAEEQFAFVLEGIGGIVVTGIGLSDIADHLKSHFTDGDRYITTLEELQGVTGIDHSAKAHSLSDVEVAVVSGAFAVAENAAIWITASSLKTRVLPFICQHLIVVLQRQNIVHNMHEAYEKIGAEAYAYGVFIAGPSKTADIEQSLVLGAHGPKTMTVFLID